MSDSSALRDVQMVIGSNPIVLILFLALSSYLYSFVGSILNWLRHGIKQHGEIEQMAE